MDYTRLKEIIEADPTLKKLFDNGEDEVVAKILNTTSEEITLVEARITKHDFHNLFGFNRTVQIIATAKTIIKADPTTPTAFALAEIMWLLENSPGLNIGHPDAGKEIAGMVAGGIITGDEGDALLSKAKKNVSFSEKEFGRTISYQDVAKAKEIK